MLNNIAVVLRGQYRTWGYVHPVVFDFYDKIAKNVDYYMVTWRQLGQYGFSNYFEPFEKYNKNLVKRTVSNFCKMKLFFIRIDLALH